MPVCSDWATATLQTPPAQPKWQLDVVGISSPVSPGQYATARLRVTNTGTGPGQATVTGSTIYPPTGERIGGWSTVQTPVLQPGQSVEVALQSLGTISPVYWGLTLNVVFTADGAQAAAQFQVAQLVPTGVQVQVQQPAPGATTTTVVVSWQPLPEPQPPGLTYEVQILNELGQVIASTTAPKTATSVQFTGVPLGLRGSVRVRACR